MRLVFRAVLPSTYITSKYSHDQQGSSAFKKSGGVVTIGGGGGGGSGGSKGFRSRQDGRYGIMSNDGPAFASPPASSRQPVVSVDISHNRGSSYSGSLDEIPLTGIAKETHVTWVVEDRSPSPDPHGGPRM